MYIVAFWIRWIDRAIVGVGDFQDILRSIETQWNFD